MGCGASAEPYQPESAGGDAPPPPVAEEPPAEEPAVAAPAEVKVGDGSGAGIMLASVEPEAEGEEDGPKDRGPVLPFVRFDKSAVSKDLSHGHEVYLRFSSGNLLGGTDGKLEAVSDEFDDGANLFIVERQNGVGPIRDGDGILLKHVASNTYMQAKSDQYPVKCTGAPGDVEVSHYFSLFKLGHPLQVRHNDTVYLQSWLSNYVESSATITGEPVLVARRWRRGPETSMTILKKQVVEATTTDLARKMQFQSFDLDGNGSISRAEMTYMLKKIKGESVEAGEVDEVMGACADDTGSIPYEKFREWADGEGLTEDQLQHGEVIGNTAQRCNDALNEENALIEVLTTAHMSTCTAMKADYAARFPNEDGSPGDLPAQLEKFSSEQDGWFFSSNWRLAIGALMEDEVDLWTRCLNDAMACWGTDEASLTYLVCSIPERVRPEIFMRYNERYGKGLLEHISSETSGSYKLVLEMQAMAPEDCRASLLNKAMAGIGTDEDQLIRVICGCDIPERRQVKEAYQRMYGKELVPTVQSETSGDFQRALLCLLEAEEAEFDIDQDCEAMKAAMDGWGTDETALVKMICSKTSRQMEMVNEKFQELYGKNLFDRVKSETSGHFQATLLGCIRHPMKQLAHTVRDCMKGWGTSETGLLTALVHLPDFKKEALIKQYRQEFGGRDLIKDIKGDCSGNYEKALLALVRPAPRVWAEAITNAMKGLGTSDQLLINFMCIAKDEMGEVRKAFKMLNGKSLVDWVEGDCSGDYKKCLAALANRNTEDDPTMRPVYWSQRARDAIKDVDCLKNILVQLPAVAIKRGMEVYQAVYGKSLSEEIGKKSEEGSSWFAWSNWYKAAMLRLCQMPVEQYVDSLHDAMNGIGTDETQLTSLVCTIPENMYQDIHSLYEAKYGSTLLSRITGECSFAYKKAMVWQAADWAESRAMALNQAMAGMGTSEDQLVRIVTNSTPAQRARLVTHTRNSTRRVYLHTSKRRPAVCFSKF
jgi:annexin A7/11